MKGLLQACFFLIITFIYLFISLVQRRQSGAADETLLHSLLILRYFCKVASAEKKSQISLVLNYFRLIFPLLRRIVTSLFIEPFFSTLSFPQPHYHHMHYLTVYTVITYL